MMYYPKTSPFKKPFSYLRSYLAKQYVRLYPSDMFIGVTGSIGKSTCVSACEAVCSQKYKTICTKADLDPVLNISQTLLRITPGVSKVILEMGVDYKGEMDFYLSLVKPKVAIFTKVALSTSLAFDGTEEILQEEGKLIESLGEKGVAILNWDDPSAKKLANLCKGRVFFYGMDSLNCTIWAGNVKISGACDPRIFENFGTSFELNLGVERVKVNFKLLGEQYLYAALAAALLGVISDIPLTKIKLALEELEPVEHKMQALPGPNGSVLIDDTYNSSPMGLESAIDTLLEISARRRIVVLGEMKDLGRRSEESHRQIARKIYKEKLDLVFLGQGETCFIADELKSLGFWEERMGSDLTSSQLVSKLLKNLGKGDVCLIKGSRAVRLDEVVKRIAKKT